MSLPILFLQQVRTRDDYRIQHGDQGNATSQNAAKIGEAPSGLGGNLSRKAPVTKPLETCFGPKSLLTLV